MIAYDIALFPTGGEYDRNNPHMQEIFEISKDLWIGKVSGFFDEKYFKDACSDIQRNGLAICLMKIARLRGVNFDPAPQYGERYSFILRNEEYDPTKNKQFDEKSILLEILALSRLIHPTSVSFFFSLRIVTDDSGNVNKIMPGDFYGDATAAFHAHESRNYLTFNEVHELKNLFEIYKKRGIEKSRVGNAFFYFELANRYEYIERRWIYVCIGLESLVNTSSERSTKQFVERVHRLSKCICPYSKRISKSKAKKMYDLRSKLSHGQIRSVRELAGQDKDEVKQNVEKQHILLYRKMEDVLRLSIKKAIEDESFYNFLNSKKLIDKEWPIGDDTKQKGKKRTNI